MMNVGRVSTLLNSVVRQDAPYELRSRIENVSYELPE